MDPSALHRRFIHLHGDPESCRRRALAQWRTGGLWISPHPPGPQADWIPAARLHTRLGQEHDLVVFDALEGLSVDALAMAAGLVRGGGTLVLLTPAPARWPRLPDPEMARRVAVGAPPRRPSPFLERLAGLLRPLAPTAPAGAGWQELTPDQAHALEAVLRTATGHGRRPLLVTADRGRGKSALLGIAAGRLWRQGRRRLLVTAPRRAAVDVLLRHFGEETRGAGRLSFLPPDALLAAPPPADLLLVDEAAGIPVPLLEGLVRNFGRVVLATTVHGYEGSGRGFLLRLGRFLDRHRPGWRHVRLERPARWAPGDPLEALMNRALLLDAEPPEAPTLPETPRPVLRRGPELAREEPRLRALFGLLASAHYRTRPSDLRYLLDASNLEVLSLEGEEGPVAAALVAREGALPGALARAVLSEGRRPRGHLLPQLLATRCDLPEALERPCRRVVRIAVHPALQGRGLGSRLLAAVVEQARAEGAALVGASFGATAELVRFWRRAGFRPLRLGHRREASSGAHGLLVARALDPDLAPRLEEAQAAFGRRFAHQLADPFRALDPETALELLPASHPPFRAKERARLRAYGEGRLPYLDVLDLLHRLAAAAGGTDQPGRRLLVLRVLQGRDWKCCAERLGLSGRREAEALLRGTVLDLVPAPIVGFDAPAAENRKRP